MADSVQIKQVNPWHAQLALYMVANPSSTLEQTARHFKRTSAWISIVRNSDAFKVYYQNMVNRQLDNMDPLTQGTQAMTDIALEKLNKKLEDIGDQLSVTELKEVADMGLKRLGFGASLGARAPSQPAVHLHAAGVVVVDRGDLESARQRMAEAHGVGASPKQIAAPLTPVHARHEVVDVEIEE